MLDRHTVEKSLQIVSLDKSHWAGMVSVQILLSDEQAEIAYRVLTSGTGPFCRPWHNETETGEGHRLYAVAAHHRPTDGVFDATLHTNCDGQSFIAAYGERTREGEDAMDYTLPPPTELSLENIVQCAAILRDLLREMNRLVQADKMMAA